MRSSPVLFERDELLALGRRRLEQAHEGRGQLLFLAGEAGIGKTRLLTALTREASRQGHRVVTAAVFPGDLELSAGLLLDLAHELTRSAEPEASAIGAAITGALAQGESATGDAHRRRRLMVLEIVDRLVEMAAAGPTMLALEDLHWSDDLTLEILSHLARRLPDLPVLVIATYRSDELYPRVPMRKWRAQLLSQRVAEEARLRRLTFDEVHSMATPAVDHARGLLQLAAGSTGLARSSLEAARNGWLARDRAWEGGWASIDLARCAYRSKSTRRGGGSARGRQQDG